MSDPINPTSQYTRSSICLIRWWFGQFPGHMDCLLRSCAANPDIDWLLLTDNPSRKNFPPNVRTHLTSLGELRQQFSEKLEMAVKLPTYEHLAMFKPALGLLFGNHLRDYDFWGCCDLDMIFGDLRKFLREDILAAHDKILGRGHLTLYRNNEKVNRYFMLDCPGALNWRTAFTSPIPVQFDEMHGINLIFRYHNLPQFRDEFIVDVKRSTRWKITRFEGIAIQNRPQQAFYWHQGKVFHTYHNCDRDLVDDEYAYIHFQQRHLPAPSFDPFTVPGFLISAQGIFPYNREPLTDEDFIRLNCDQWLPKKVILRTIGRGIGKRLGLIPRNKPR